MPITNRDQQELDQIYTDYKTKYNGRKEDYFALLYLTKKFKCKIEEIAHQVAFGNTDYGIDAYYFDSQSRNLYMYQFKWSEDHNLFKESLERILNTGISVLFGTENINPNENEYIRFFKYDLNKYKDAINRVYFQMVFKGDVEKAESSKGLSFSTESLQAKKHVIENAFGSRTIEVPSVEFISDSRRPPLPPPQDTFDISFTSAASVQTQDNSKVLHVGFMPLYDLYKIYLALDQRLLDRNIRSVLDPDNPPNKKIREALTRIVLKCEETSELFPFYHNGITLAAEKLDFSDGHAIIRVPRLLNGAQTISSFKTFIDENEGPILAKNKSILENLNVLTKIIVTDLTSDFVTAVTISNNQQNPVEPWNLRANDKIQCDLEDKFLEQASIAYSRQEKAFENLSEEEKEELKDSRRPILIKPLAQTFLAMQGEIDRISRLREVFEVKKQYEDCFRESYLRSDVRRIVLAYKVFLILNGPLNKLAEVSPQWLSDIIRPGRNLVWALLLQGVFNDKKLPIWLDTYTENLTRDQGFREDVSSIASAKLVPLLREVLKTESYKNKISENKLNFIRTKEIYKKCMTQAYDRFGWVKQSF